MLKKFFLLIRQDSIALKLLDSFEDFVDFLLKLRFF